MCASWGGGLHASWGWGCASWEGACFWGGCASWGACMLSRGVHASQGGVWLQGGAWLWGVHGCRGACMVMGGMVAGGGGVHGCGGMHGGSGHAWWRGGACVGYDEIWLMSGQYASYWNALLFLVNITFITVSTTAKRTRYKHIIHRPLSAVHSFLKILKYMYFVLNILGIGRMI